MTVAVAIPTNQLNTSNITTLLVDVMNYRLKNITTLYRFVKTKNPCFPTPYYTAVPLVQSCTSN